MGAMARRIPIVGVIVTGFIFASCSTQSSNLTSAQKQYVSELRGPPASMPSQTSDQTLVNAGRTICADVGNGLTKAEVSSRFGLNLYSDAQINAVVDAAVDHLCPRFKGQLPNS